MGRCRRHPHHLVVGVCAYCLDERLCALSITEDVMEVGNTAFNVAPSVAPRSNPSIWPETIAASRDAAHRMPQLRTPRSFKQEDVSAETFVVHQSVFSLSPPQHQLGSDSYSPLPIRSPRNHQVLLGNHEFIKGDVPKKKKSSRWPFLHRRKRIDFDSIELVGTSDGHANHVLRSEGAVHDNYMHDSNVYVKKQWRYGLQMPNTCIACENAVASQEDNLSFEKCCRSQLKSSPIAAESRGGHDAPVCKDCLLQSSAARKNHHHCRSSKHKSPCIALLAPGSKATIGLSPLRHETHLDDKDDLLHSSDGGFESGGDPNRSYACYSPSAIHSHRCSRSQSKSCLAEMLVSGPHTSTSSPNINAMNVKNMSFSKDVDSGGSRCKAIARDKLRSPIADFRKHSQDDFHFNEVGGTEHGSPTVGLGGCIYGKGSNNGSLNHFYHTNVSPSFSHCSMYGNLDAHSKYDCPGSSKQAPNSRSRTRRDSVSIECGKTRKVSPLMLSAHDLVSSPRSYKQQSTDQSVPYFYALDDENSGKMLRYLHSDRTHSRGSSSLPSDDDFCANSWFSDREVSKSRKTTAKPRASWKKGVHHPQEYKKEPAFGSHIFAYPTRSWGKALGSMLGIRSKKKHSTKADVVLPSASTDNLQHEADMLQNGSCYMHQGQADDETFSNFIEYGQCNLHPDNYHHHCQRRRPHLSHQTVGAEDMRGRESRTFDCVDDIDRSPRYSFLRKDYSAFSCYFTPPLRSVQAAKQMQGENRNQHIYSNPSPSQLQSNRPSYDIRASKWN
ncbi:hypothetical protein KP509_18G012800 [Ceratopteris richardii]|uniref:Uncharacterized protein n=1 Tax=Ceratopteris richardii TaxID=49495 RepID=A0A8T2SNF3_CERRI|nr:hypothetical protein KP509_18G012800 [Ceratopteris richardii]